LAKFERTLLEFHSSEFYEIFSIVRTPARLSNGVKKIKILTTEFRAKVGEIRQTPEFKPSYLLKTGAESRHKNFFTAALAL